MSDQEIKRLGRYEVIGELGRGAMGVVYKARDPQIDRLVAVKSIRLYGLEAEQETEFRQRFTLEAQAAGRLQHPGIVTVFDVGEDAYSREPFIVLEYVAGESLSRLLSREKKLPLARALQLTEELADALDYAHSQAVVHRDIKPSNILVTEDGHAKIADFGIAKLNLAHVTIPGRVLGTPAYMSPEQLVGDAADHRSDLFSLGVVLYAMVAGHPPFHGDSATTVCFKVVNREPVPASAFDLELPQALDPVISRALAKDPAERYQSGSELASDLHQLRLQFTSSSTASIVPRMTTTTSRRTVPGNASSGTSRQEGLEQAYRLFATALRKSTIRELVFASALLTIFLMLAIPVRRSQSDKSTSGSSPAAASQNSHASDNSQPVAQNGVATHDQNPSSQSSMIPHPPLKQLPNSGARIRKAAPTPFSTLQLIVQHQFKDAILMVWIDDKLVLTRTLHGGSQRHLVVFNTLHGAGSDTLQVPAGLHQVRLQAQSSDLSIDLSKTIAAEFLGGDDRTLQVTFDRRNTVMHLAWQ
ncbi:MAG TPA: serine/threonine-protein kinase [Candidatus Sulfotelmatobacter sp.]|nr:serine/threonine-protein kinase [Candidatus Sulfotelmatobacter sp.]